MLLPRLYPHLSSFNLGLNKPHQSTSRPVSIMSENIIDSQMEYFLTLLPLLDNINWSVQQLGPSFQQIEPFQHVQQSVHQIQQSIQKLQQPFQELQQGFQKLYDSIQKLQQCFQKPFHPLEHHLQQFQQVATRQIGQMNEDQSRRDERKEGEYKRSDAEDIEMSDI